MRKNVRKGYRARRRNRKGRTYRRRKTFTKAVRRIINKQVEKKYKFYTGNANIYNTGYALYLTNIAQGTSDTTRVGDQVTLRSLRFKVSCSVYTAALTSYVNWIRCVIIQYYPTFDSSSYTATTYPLSNFLIDTTSYPYISPYSHDNRFNFKVLYDKTALVDTVNQPQYCFRGIIKRFPKRFLQYYAGSTTNHINGIHMILISDQATLPPTFLYSIKLNYGDA